MHPRHTRKHHRGGVGINDHMNAQGRTQLFIAARDGREDEVKRLIEAGADVDKVNKNGVTALFIASQNGYLNIVEKLVTAGADVNKGIAPDDVTALFIASKMGQLNVVERLIAAGANLNKGKDKPLYIALQNRHVDIVDRLIKAGADVNITNYNETPLFMALKRGYLNIVESLIEAGANVNPVGNATIPLFIASKHGYTDIVKTLLDAGANPNVISNYGTTPLFIAIINGYAKIVEHLIAAGADVEKSSTSGDTPLYIASKQGYTKIVEQLIAAGADVNKTNTSNGNTPLFISSKQGFMDIVKRILAAGGDKTITNMYGQTPIDVAKTQEIRAFIELGQEQKEHENTLKWHGWTQGDASMLDGVFGDEETAKNFALCPVCMKYVVRSDACMYMSHNCSTAKGYYHDELYMKYKNSSGIVNWCTICGRISKGHNHFNLVPAQGPVPAVIIGKDPFAKSCEIEGGGGVTEKLLRFRRLREYAKELQVRVGNIGWWEAMDKLCEEMWDAPLVKSKEVLATMLETKKFNIPSTNFPLILPPMENAPNVPNTAESPIIHPSETEAFKNALYIDDVNIIQFQHKMANGAWNRHKNQGQQISREGFISWLKSMLENPTAEEFGKCWQYKTRSQQAALNASQKALVCDAVLHPEEVKAALDLTDAEQVRLAEGYRKAFNSAFDIRRLMRPRL